MKSNQPKEYQSNGILFYFVTYTSVKGGRV